MEPEGSLQCSQHTLPKADNSSIPRNVSRLMPFYLTNLIPCVISGFRRDVNEICALLGYYAAYSGNSVPTFRGNLSVPSSSVKKSKKKLFLLGLLDT
jgi:hypothetical protein